MARTFGARFALTSAIPTKCKKKKKIHNFPLFPMGSVISLPLLQSPLAPQPCQSANSFIRSPFKVIHFGSFIPYRPYAPRSGTPNSPLCTSVVRSHLPWQLPSHWAMVVVVLLLLAVLVAAHLLDDAPSWCSGPAAHEGWCGTAVRGCTARWAMSRGTTG